MFDVFTEVIVKKVIFAVVTHLDFRQTFVELMIIQISIVDPLFTFQTLVRPRITVSMEAAVNEFFISK